MKHAFRAAAIFLLIGAPARAHRLDEYLQGTIISLEKSRVAAEITLTPGIAVFPLLVALIDADGNGVISPSEQRAYAGRILRDLSLKIDGNPVTPHLSSMHFPAMEEMKNGLGEISLQVIADLPPGGVNRKLIFENHHQSGFGAYQVNSLVPRDPGIRILAQHRNYSQSFYQVDFAQAVTRSEPWKFTWPGSVQTAWGTMALVLAAWLGVQRNRWVRVGHDPAVAAPGQREVATARLGPSGSTRRAGLPIRTHPTEGG